VSGVPALKIEKLTKTYSNGFLALDGVSLEVGAGKFVGLLGPNGAGKTTLINSVVSLARPDSGSVEVYGKDAFREFREARRMIGVSPQEVNLDKFLTVREVLTFHAGYYGVPRKKAKEKAEEMLERFGLAPSCTTRRCYSWMSRRLGWTWSFATVCGATSGNSTAAA
jgi:ABC-2 type transport system ATP-binding protein